MEDLEAPKLIKSDTNDITVINRTPFVVGRGLNCDYILAHKIISREHCKFQKIDNQWFLIDTSTNGTFLNDQIVKADMKPLRDGDVIQLSKDLDFTYTFGLSIREEITDEQLCMIADSVLESIEVVASNEPGPSTSAVRTELKHTLPTETVDTGELPKKRIKISNLSPPKDKKLTAGSVIDLTEDSVVEVSRVSSGVIDLSDSFQVLPSASSDLKIVIQKVSVEKDLSSETEKSGSQQPSTSAGKDVKTDEKCESDKDLDVDEDLICSVCSEMFVKATTLNCSHSFCKLCIETWRTKQSVCPICRTKITSMNPTIVIDNLIDAFVQKSSKSVQESRKELIEERKELDKNKATNSKSSNHTSAIPNPNHPPATPHLILDLDSDEVTSDSTLDSDEGWDDEWYSEDRQPYYGGYGRCYVCHRAGHWANSCPFR